jgi:hypothetical protein
MDNDEQFNTISTVESCEIPRLRKQLTQQGFRVYELDGSQISSGHSLFAEIKRKLPLDPLLIGETIKWDAVADSLWGGLDSVALERSVIIWTNADHMLENGTSDLGRAIEVVRQVAGTLADPTSGVSIPQRLTLILAAHASQLKTLDRVISECHLRDHHS